MSWVQQYPSLPPFHTSCRPHLCNQNIVSRPWALVMAGGALRCFCLGVSRLFERCNNNEKAESSLVVVFLWIKDVVGASNQSTGGNLSGYKCQMGCNGEQDHGDDDHDPGNGWESGTLNKNWKLFHIFFYNASTPQIVFELKDPQESRPQKSTPPWLPLNWVVLGPRNKPLNMHRRHFCSHFLGWKCGRGGKRANALLAGSRGCAPTAQLGRCSVNWGETLIMGSPLPPPTSWNVIPLIILHLIILFVGRKMCLRNYKKDFPQKVEFFQDTFYSMWKSKVLRIFAD